MGVYQFYSGIMLPITVEFS